MIKWIGFISLLLLSNVLCAQDHDHDLDHEDHAHHDHHKNEIGIANSPVYFVKEKEWAYGLHMHYLRSIANSKMSVGLGYERIFDEHKHTTIGVVGGYRPKGGWVINFAPGVTLENDDWSELNFAVHLETTYEFELDNLHIGPVLELAYDPEDYHISFGLHVGYGF